MQTQCPKCSTVFRMTETQLEVAMGIVRCGQCQNVFNAIHHQKSTESNSTLPLEVVNHPQGSNQEPKEVLRRVLSPAKPPRKTSMNAGWSAGIFILSLILFAQITYWQRDEWAKQPELRPYIEKACKTILRCKLAAKRSIDKLELLSRNIYTHPNTKEALMISAVIANKADFAQPYPLLLVSMSNVRGQIVAQRYFKPAEYLPTLSSTEIFQSNATLTVKLEIVDPGNDAIAFELDFL